MCFLKKNCPPSQVGKKKERRKSNRSKQTYYVLWNPVQSRSLNLNKYISCLIFNLYNPKLQIILSKSTPNTIFEFHFF